MTYRSPKTGRQFVVIAAGGGNKYNQQYSSKLVAFALPQKGDGIGPRLISAITQPVIARSRSEYRGTKETLPAAVAPQPIPFSHRTHAETGMQCLDCHTTTMTAERASLPEASHCLTCHETIKANSRAIASVRGFATQHQPGPWERVYKLPGFVVFSHEKHVKAGTACSQCHGPVETRDVLEKEVSTGMTECMNCHRKRQVSIDCSLCHELGQ
jgi:hypothetical protein